MDRSNIFSGENDGERQRISNPFVDLTSQSPYLCCWLKCCKLNVNS